MRAATLALGAAAAGAATGVEQIHLTPSGAADSVAVDFVTFSGAATSCKYGPTPALGSSVPAASQAVTLNQWAAVMNQAELTGLAPQAVVHYTCGSESDGWSAIANFTHAPARQRYAVYADFGLLNDVSLKALIADSDSGGFDYVIHAGDFAYDLDSAHSTVGNGFMNAVQPYLSRRPVLPSPGNHEAYGTQGGGAFAQFAARFRSVEAFAGARSGSNTSLWWSVNLGQVHFLAFTSETWTMTAAQVAAQAAWIAADVAAVDRSVTPWVVAASHKWWMMDQTNASIFDWMGPAGVDLFFTGHWHQYTRYPSLMNTGTKATIDAACLSPDNGTYTDCKYPIAVVVGAPGNQEVDPRSCTEEYALKCSGNYGYAHFEVFNATHAHFRWDTTEANGDPADWFDAFWVVKSGSGGGKQRQRA